MGKQMFHAYLALVLFALSVHAAILQSKSTGAGSSAKRSPPLPLSPLDAGTAAAFANAPLPKVVKYVPRLSHRNSPQIEPILPPDALLERSGAPTPLRERFIIGADDRKIVTSNTFPYKAMGRVRIAPPGSQVGTWCSGTLVGRRHVLFATHCVLDTANQGNAYIFQPLLNTTELYPSSAATALVYVNSSLNVNDPCWTKTDYAIAVLADPLGDASRQGALGVSRTFDATLGDRQIFYHFGYPSDKSGSGLLPYMQQYITASPTTRCNGGPIDTNADMIPGQSGGPLWLAPDAAGNRYVFGVMSSGSSTRNTFGGGGQDMVDFVAQVKSDYP